METWQATTQFRRYKFWKASRYENPKLFGPELLGKIASWNANSVNGVLQQRWTCLQTGKTEWRDIPLVEERENE